MRKLLSSLFSIALVMVVAGTAYAYRDKLAPLVQNIREAVTPNPPCYRPIYYSIGNFDTRFGLSKQQFIADMGQAGSIWDDAVDRQLFAYSPDATFKVNLIFDNRQQATDQLKKLGIVINDDKATYDDLKARYDAAQADYKNAKTRLDAASSDYEKKKRAYEEEVSYWNTKGGAPPAEYDKLKRDQDTLNAQAASINQLVQELNQLGTTINSLVSVLNRLARELNLQISQFNSVGSSTGREFDEGEYVRDASGKRINIYQFNSEGQLIRVLAHEFGHALGLEHINSNPKAIMYYLNQSNNAMATPEDMAALRKLCGIK